MTTGIVLSQRPHDFMASEKGRPEVWESGQTETEALQKISRRPGLANAPIGRDLSSYEIHQGCPSSKTLK